jgi:hypothetical protein
MVRNNSRRGGVAVRLAMLVLLASTWMASSAFALDVSDARWGFNGKVALNRFNLLSVLVENPTPKAFEGELRLRKTSLGAGFVDAPIVEPVTLAPFERRRVQFYPFIVGDGRNSVGNEEWKVQWGRGESYDVPAPRVAKFQRVVLDDSSGIVSGRAGALRPMPENLFPAFVTATDALQVLGMDREPRSWIPAQKEALLDWLRLGGTVVLFHGPSGKFPEFTGPLTVLNSPLEETRFGTGRVLKLAKQRNQFDADEARQLFVNLPKNFVALREKAEDPIDEVDPTQQTQQTQQMPNAEGLQYSEGSDPLQSRSFLSQLKNMTKPDHNWVLLHLMFWVYIGMIFPGCYIIGKKWSDFRVVYAGLLGTVMLFSFLFSVVGQRGYGEATAVHSVAIARALPDGACDVASWSNVFVTGGADYEIKHNGRGALYSTCNDNESVNGIINNGVEAEFMVDIPPFSNREFAHRIKLPTGGPTLKVQEYQIKDGRLDSLRIGVEGLTPSDVMNQFVLFGSRFYNVSWQGASLKLSGDAGDVTSMLGIQTLHQWSNNYNYGYGPYAQQQEQTPAQRFSLMFKPLLSRSLNVTREAEAQQVQLPSDMIRVYLYAKMPADFAVQNQRLGKQEGQVLFSIDLQLNEK